MREQFAQQAVTVICRRHQWVRTKTPGVLICAKCDTRGREKQPQTTVQTPPDYSIDDLSESEFSTKMPASARKYMPSGQYQHGNTRFHVKYEPPPQRPATKKRHPVNIDTDEQVTEQRRSIHWLVFVGVGMLVMLALWQGGSMVLNTWNTWQDDRTYGRPRTYQTDAYVGHNETPGNPSHFVVLNLNKRVLIIEFPGGDPTHARVYLGPTLIGNGQDLTPITITFKDVNDDHKPDMLIHIQDQIVVFINDNGQFRPARPGEHVNL